MNPARAGRTAVLGLGNPILSDDRAGLAVVEEFSRLLQRAPVDGVDVLISTRGGLELMDLLSGYERAIIADCLVVPDATPGRVHRLSLDNLAGSARLVNPHEASLAQVFGLAQALSVPMPSSVEIFGIEAADATTVSEQMSPAVDAAARELAREIHHRLHSA